MVLRLQRHPFYPTASQINPALGGIHRNREKVQITGPIEIQFTQLEIPFYFAMKLLLEGTLASFG